MKREDYYGLTAMWGSPFVMAALALSGAPFPVALIGYLVPLGFTAIIDYADRKDFRKFEKQLKHCSTEICKLNKNHSEIENSWKNLESNEQADLNSFERLIQKSDEILAEMKDVIKDYHFLKRRLASLVMVPDKQRKELPVLKHIEKAAPKYLNEIQNKNRLMHLKHNLRIGILKIEELEQKAQNDINSLASLNKQALRNKAQEIIYNGVAEKFNEIEANINQHIDPNKDKTQEELQLLKRLSDKKTSIEKLNIQKAACVQEETSSTFTPMLQKSTTSSSIEVEKSTDVPRMQSSLIKKTLN